MEKQLRIWWSRRVPITNNSLEHYRVKDLVEAIKKMKELAKRDLANKLITDNVTGLEVFEDGEWSEFYDDKGRDIDEIMR